MSNVSLKRLGDLINLKRGYDLPEKKRIHGLYPVISSSGISGYHNEYKVDGKGVVTGRYGTLGVMYYVDGKYWPHNTALYVQNFKNNDPKYIYYLLSCLGRIKTSDKSAVPGVNRNELHEMIVPIIEDKRLQCAIANFLSNIDEKIALNNKINAEFEALAKLIYDYWFVQFDFPDANGKPYKSSGGKMIYNMTLKCEIPQYWEAVPIAELLKIKTGKKDANHATTYGKYDFFTCGDKVLRCDDYEFDGKSILLAGNGNFNVKRFEGKFNAYQRTYVLIPENTNFYSLVFYSVQYRVEQLTKGSRGSIVKFIAKGDIEDIYIAMPKDRGDYFYKILNSIFEKIHVLERENIVLNKLRDWIQPMLMNGQASVL